jgi:tetratricopeptide (TPR) repeat protein
LANRNKITLSAQKHIARGQWDRAVRELQKLVAEDPKDVRTLLKLGDVYSKKGDRENATRVYRQVADSYSEQGFFLKAVAVFKQILKHDQGNMDITVRLAQLYEQLGLTREASSQYQLAVSHLEEVGNENEVLNMLKRIIDLDPANVASSIRLAEAYSKAGRAIEAVQAFDHAGRMLKEQNRLSDYVKVAERLVFHDPSRVDVIKEVAKHYLALGDTKRGLAKLQICFKADSRDEETLSLLARAFEDLGQTQKTIFVYRELAALYGETHRAAQMKEMYTKILALDPSDPESRKALGMQAMAGHSVHPPSPFSNASAPLSSGGHEPLSSSVFRTSPPAAPYPTELGAAPGSLPKNSADPVEELLILHEVDVGVPEPEPAPMEAYDYGDVDKLLTETDVFVKYGLRDKALEHLRRIFAIQPDNPAAYLKMKQIHLQAGDRPRAAEALSNYIHIQTRQGRDDLAQSARQELQDLAPGHPLAMVNDEDQDAETHLGGLEISIDLDDVDAVGIADNDREAFVLPDDDEPLGSMLDLSEMDALEATPSIHELDILSAAPERATSSTRPTRLVEEPSPFVDWTNRQADDLLVPPIGLPFRSIQGPFDESQDASESESAWTRTYDEQIDESVSAGSGSIMEGLDVSSEMDGSEGLDSFALTMSGTRSSEAGLSEAIAEEEIEEAEFLFEAGLEVEAQTRLQELMARYPNHPRARALFDKIMAQQEAFLSGDILSDEELDSAFGVLTEEEPEIDEATAQDHYDQGMLFRELGRLDDAIRQFETAARAPSRAVDCLELVGHCLLEKNEPMKAIESFQQAIARGAQGAAATNLKFEIGTAYLSIGNRDQARTWLSACHQENPKHRTVAKDLDALGAAPGKARAGTKEKISYL